jgi:hypothetical protein
MKKNISVLITLFILLPFLNSCKKDTLLNDSNVENSSPLKSSNIEYPLLSYSFANKPAPPSGQCAAYTKNAAYFPEQLSTYSPGAYSFSLVTGTVNSEDPYYNQTCNTYEFLFAGSNWNRVVPLTYAGLYATGLVTGNPFGWWINNLQNNVTKVYVPKSFIEDHFGTPQNFNNHIRLGFVPIIIYTEE